jgi:hypothetical protein
MSYALQSCDKSYETPVPVNIFAPTLACLIRHFRSPSYSFLIRYPYNFWRSFWIPKAPHFPIFLISVLEALRGSLGNSLNGRHCLVDRLLGGRLQHLEGINCNIHSLDVTYLWILRRAPHTYVSIEERLNLEMAWWQFGRYRPPQTTMIYEYKIW